LAKTCGPIPSDRVDAKFMRHWVVIAEGYFEQIGNIPFQTRLAMPQQDKPIAWCDVKKQATTRTINGIEVEVGSGNVFADLGLPDADKLKIKSGLVIEINRAIA
jgi:hypothetical protein